MASSLPTTGGNPGLDYGNSRRRISDFPKDRSANCLRQLPIKTFAVFYLRIFLDTQTSCVLRTRLRGCSNDDMLARRDILKAGLAGGAYSLLGSSSRRRAFADTLPSSPRTTPFVVELPIAPLARPVDPFPTLADPANCVNVDGTTAFHVSGPRAVPTNTQFFLIHERAASHSFHPELPPNVIWGYDGMSPGPTFLARSGTPSLVRFVNDLPMNDPVGIGEPISAIHRHGGFQFPEDDGYPLDTFCTSQSRDYFYPNEADDLQEQNEHSTLWYHDHAIDITGMNVYRGLAGFFLNFDRVDSIAGELDTGAAALRLPGRMVALPSGDQFRQFDVPLVFQDKRFDQNGFLAFDTFDHNGFLGDKFLVNGVVQPFLKVARRKYRFRCMNGSNARNYEFFLSNGQPFVAIATDSHLLEHPVTVKSFRIAPAERVEVIIDFTNTTLGQEIFLVNRLEQTSGRKPGDLVSPGTQILKFVVDRDTDDPSRVPDTLRAVTEGPQQLLPKVTVQRTFDFERSDGAWVINGEFFDENRINAKPKRDGAEIWILKSGVGWVHPVHIHLTEFFILSRNGSSPPPLELARKDTIVIGSDRGDVKILLPLPANFHAVPRPVAGRFVFHCHNIEHEDMRMMAQFEVQP